MKIKNCILVNVNQSISVKCSQSKGTASFKYYGLKPVRGLAPGGINDWAEGENDPDYINTDILDGQLIFDQHIKQGFEVAF